MTSHQKGLSNSRDYEREAEQTRRRLADNLDELSDRLTPGQVLDEMLTYSRAGGGTFLTAFSNAVRQNPLPSLLIGAGCMMFLSEKMGVRPGFGGLGNGGRATNVADQPSGVASGSPARSDGAGRMSDAAHGMTHSAAMSARDAAASASSGLVNAAETTQRRAFDLGSGIVETARQTAASAGDTAANAADAARRAAYDAQGAASHVADQMRRNAQNAVGAVRDSATSMGFGAADAIGNTAASVRDAAASSGALIADTADRTRRHAADTVRQGHENAASFIAEQPLLCAAIGVAVGAALASMLPSTEAENRLMGETSDAVKGAAKDVGAKALDSAKNVASKVTDCAQTAAAEEGLTASALADAARNVGEEAKKDAHRDLGDPMTGTGPQEGVSGPNDS